ncbi:MAG: carbohydrate-binding family 9-like protein [Victivallales bacterium]
MNKLTAFLALVIGTAVTINAQAESRTALAVKTARPPVIDGKLGVAEWTGALWQNSFTSYGADEAQTPQQSRFAVMFDDKNMYFAVRCEDVHVKKIKPYYKNNVGIWRHDGVEIFIQSIAQSGKYLQFLISAGGGRCGLKIAVSPTCTRIKTRDEVPLTQWQAEAALDSGGYVIEIKIPLALFTGGKPVNGTEWRLNVHRNALTPDSDRYSTWAPMIKTHASEKFGYLIFAFAEPELIQMRITRKRKFNALVSRIEKLQAKYAKFDPQFAAAVNTRLKAAGWEKFRQTGIEIEKMNRAECEKFALQLSKFAAQAENFKQFRADYLKRAFFKE